MTHPSSSCCRLCMSFNLLRIWEFSSLKLCMQTFMSSNSFNFKEFVFSSSSTYRTNQTELFQMRGSPFSKSGRLLTDQKKKKWSYFSSYSRDTVNLYLKDINVCDIPGYKIMGIIPKKKISASLNSKSGAQPWKDYESLQIYSARRRVICRS